ncbi:MAG: Re/Si-specific NAD(P)(+) transhydrogenase subunit alpha [Nitrospirae bacterium]|nr:Re/Si-specific NAD(P)(+) transhydrogenase subunit alpha [Nitrospirota bacterium]
MSINIGFIKEITPDEKRVALVPESVKKLSDKGFRVFLEKGAGEKARYHDLSYKESGAEILESAKEALSRSQIILKVQPPSPDEIEAINPDSFLIGFLQHYKYPERINMMADKKINAFAMELIPRITRAQSIDALSSQAAVAGYKAAIIAANMSSRFFPMLTTAAGTIRPSRVLVIGAGVAGLQAIATSRRLGAIVEAYDVRKAVKEEIQSLGAKFLESPLVAEGAGGYARELTQEEKDMQHRFMADNIGRADIVISTAQVPGKRAPIIITKDMVEKMKPSSIIIDIAAENGGNCELTKPGEIIDYEGVLIYGPLNLPSTLATHASEMYSKNLLNFLILLTKEGKTLDVDFNDEILLKSCVIFKGEIKI